MIFAKDLCEWHCPHMISGPPPDQLVNQDRSLESEWRHLGLCGQRIRGGCSQRKTAHNAVGDFHFNNRSMPIGTRMSVAITGHTMSLRDWKEPSIDRFRQRHSMRQHQSDQPRDFFNEILSSHDNTINFLNRSINGAIEFRPKDGGRKWSLGSPIG
jgi:hypothetical protein